MLIAHVNGYGFIRDFMISPSFGYTNKIEEAQDFELRSQALFAFRSNIVNVANIPALTIFDIDAAIKYPQVNLGKPFDVSGVNALAEGYPLITGEKK
jgi:hypothetical protein